LNAIRKFGSLSGNFGHPPSTKRTLNPGFGIRKVFLIMLRMLRSGYQKFLPYYV